MNNISFLTYPSKQKAGVPPAYVLLHSNLPQWVLVNETSFDIACLLQEGGTIHEVASSLSNQFHITPQSALRDVQYVIDQLTDHQFFSPAPEDFSDHHPRLSDLFVHVTSRCNLTCPYCYYPNASSEDLPPGILKQNINEMVELGGKSITFSGGEPLLYPFLKDTLKQAAQGRLSIRLLTNGTLIDQEWAGFLSELGEVSVQVSIDGARREIHDSIRGRGTFDQALRGIACLQEAGLGERITISTTVTQQNLPELGDMIDLAEKLGIPNLRFLPLRKTGRAKKLWDVVGASLAREDYERFYDRVLARQGSKHSSMDISCGLSGFLLAMPEDCREDNVWCPVGKKLVVNPNGDVFPCVLLMKEPYILGNIFRQSLEQILSSENLVQVITYHRERKKKIKKCLACTWRNLCQSGCMGQALDEKGTIWDTDRFCAYRQRLYRQAFGKLLQKFCAHS